MSSGCAATTRALAQSSGIGEVGMAAVCSANACGGSGAGTMAQVRRCDVRRAGVLAAVLLLAACDDALPAAEPAPLTGEVLQFRRDSEARIVQVRLTAREET